MKCMVYAHVRTWGRGGAAMLLGAEVRGRCWVSSSVTLPHPPETKAFIKPEACRFSARLTGQQTPAIPLSPPTYPHGLPTSTEAIEVCGHTHSLTHMPEA